MGKQLWAHNAKGTIYILHIFQEKSFFDVQTHRKKIESINYIG